MGQELLNSTSLLSKENSDALVLYNSAASPCARRVRISLLEKGLDFDTVEMNLINMEQRSPDYLSLNPNGYVPTLSHGDYVIYDSQAINEYLDETFPDRPLMPKTRDERAKVRSWIAAEETFANLFRPLLYQAVMGPIQHISRTLEEARIINQASSQDPKDIAWGDKIWQMSILSQAQERQQESALLAWLDTLDTALENKTFLVANYFTQADISLYPRVKMMSYLGLNLDPNRFANVIAWMDRLSMRTSFKESMSEQGKKLEKLANSSLLVKLRRLLKQPSSNLNLLDKSFIWGFGRLIRKIQKVELTLKAIEKNHRSFSHGNIARDLPMPRKGVAMLAQNKAVQSELYHKAYSKSVNAKALPDEKVISLIANSHTIESHKITLLLDVLTLKYHYQDTHAVQGISNQNTQISSPPKVIQPLIKCGAFELAHVIAICEYLIEQFDTKQRWMGASSWQKAQVRMWVALDMGTQKEFAPLWDKYLDQGIKQPIATEKITAQDEAFYLNRILQKCQVLEDKLSLTPYLTGDVMSLADLVWYSRFCYLIKIPGFSLSNFNAIAVWYKGLASQFKPLDKQVALA